MQLFTATPSTITVQAPQFPVSQPMCVPVRSRSSRRRWTSSRLTSTSRSYTLAVDRDRDALTADGLDHAAASTARTATVSERCLRYSADAWTSDGGSRSAPRTASRTAPSSGAELRTTGVAATHPSPILARPSATTGGCVDDAGAVAADRDRSEAVTCAVGGRNRDLRQQLARRDGSHVDPHEELVGGHGPLAVDPADGHRRAQGGDQRWKMVRGVVGADVPADRPPVSNLDVRDLRGDLAHDRTRLGDLGGEDHLGERGHRPELQGPVSRSRDRSKLLEAVEVDEHVGCRRPGLHHVREGLPAGERAGAVVRREEPYRVLDRRRARVFDRSEEHAADSTHRAARLSRTNRPAGAVPV